MLSDAEKQEIFKLAEELTGASQSNDSRFESILSNVQRRMRECGCESWSEYFARFKLDSEERRNLISALTIHTTAWFRENPHFVMFQELLLSHAERREPFRVWCAACSTGEEVYSFALVMEEFRKFHPHFDYRIYGSDIDPISIEAAETAVYNKRAANFNLEVYSGHLLYGSGDTVDLFTLTKDLRSRCQFRVHDLRSQLKHPNGPFDVIICRNVLIYFSADGTKNVVGNLIQNLKSDGHLILGHSESFNSNDFNVTSRGHSVYQNSKPTAATVKPLTHLVSNEPSPTLVPTPAPAPQKEKQPPKTGMFRISSLAGNSPSNLPQEKFKLRILAVDDTRASRHLLSKVFQDLGFECETAETTDQASILLSTKKFDLITLDLQMKGMEGGAWLNTERARGLKLPVVIVSDIRREDAQGLVSLLGRLAQEYIEKSDLLHKANEIRETFNELLRMSQGISGVRKTETLRSRPSYRPDIVCFGASTGGPQTLTKILARMPTDAPPILITQHISAKFAQAFAERLETVTGLRLAKMEDGEQLVSGHLYIALDDYHIGVQESVPGKLALMISHAPHVNRHRPSVDYLFQSISKTSADSMNVILTGMGRDGAIGLKELHNRGNFCVAQTESDCIVFGMPREAINLGAVDFVGTADEIRTTMLDSFFLSSKSKAS